MITSEGQFRAICEENGRIISEQVIDDPFVYARLRPRGLRAAWAVLWGRFELAVRVRGEHNAVYRAVMTADYTPDPPREQIVSEHDLQPIAGNCSGHAPQYDRGCRCPACVEWNERNLRSGG